MKEFKGSNFLFLLILLWDIFYIIPLTKHALPGWDTAINSLPPFIAIISVTVHIGLVWWGLLWPFNNSIRTVRWGEDICTYYYMDSYKQDNPRVRFSILLLAIYIVYQPYKKVINWMNKHLTIKIK